MTVKRVFSSYPKLLFQPGTAYHYSNTGYLMLGIIAERVSNKTMKELFNEKYIHPLGLIHTVYADQYDSGGLVNVSYDSNGTVYENTENPANPHAAGSIVSIPDEEILMFAALLNGSIISSTSLNKMFLCMNCIEETSTAKVYYGSGISLIKITVPGKEAYYIGHKGKFSFFNSIIYYTPQKKAFCSIVVNQEITALDPMMFELLEEL